MSTTDLTTQDDAETTKNRTGVRLASDGQPEEQYDKTLPGPYDPDLIRHPFVSGILDEINKSWRVPSGRILDRHDMDHEEPGALLVYPCETRIFVGRDDTAHTRGDYGFAVRPEDPIPLPNTVEQALDLLKPLGVRQALAETGDLPPRQGEWWLLETDRKPASRVFKGGVSKRPFNGSPLANHVPTEFAFGVEASELFDWVAAEYPDIVCDGDDLQDVLNRLQKATEIEQLDDVEPQYDRPTFDELRDVADGVFVRGTLRHRERDHYVERIGDDWHLARTHSMTVYTADDTRGSVRRD